MNQEKVAIIIPIYNLWEKMTVPCLEALARESQNNNIHIYLIDNASSDVTEERAQNFGTSLFADKFTYFRFDKNYGFAKACNKGAKLAAQDFASFLFFLNNDTIVTKDWLPPLLKAFEKDDTLGACGPLLLFPTTNRVQHVGVSQNPLGESEHIYLNFPSSHPLIHKKRNLNYITGAALLIRSKLFFKFGLFCEAYLNGFEDLDLCTRLRENAYTLQVITESIIYHYESQTEGRSYADNENAKIFANRNKKLPYDDALLMKKDGYIPSLTKELQYYISIPKERAEEYTKTIQSLPTFNVNLCEKLLEKEPLWIEGYNMLSSFYESQNRLSDACFMLELAVNFCPKMEHYENLIAFYQKYSERERAIHVQNVMERIIIKGQDSKYQSFVANRFAMLAERDTLFNEIYSTRL